ncbi:hypothetical protein LOAG_07296 [Loa loa]|uniref:Uncharacterized protein n=1 Tax=Loa loa TaxID=7209 RepID=A0A1S0TVW7_LOALO|nr:hypothetical protein LOAG_07296 [Loa loa]EFO21196.1 hypothetical protein LOAG_07296 [Loa loa]
MPSIVKFYVAETLYSREVTCQSSEICTAETAPSTKFVWVVEEQDTAAMNLGVQSARPNDLSLLVRRICEAAEEMLRVVERIPNVILQIDWKRVTYKRVTFAPLKEKTGLRYTILWMIS